MNNLEFVELNAQELEDVNGGEPGWLTIFKFENGHFYLLGFKLF